MADEGASEGATRAVCWDCGDLYPAARAKIGYRTCLPCGDYQAHQVKWTVTIPYSKGAYQVVNPADLAHTNPKRAGG